MRVTTRSLQGRMIRRHGYPAQTTLLTFYREMGLLDRFLSFLSFKKKQANILVIGLDNAGKSSVINYLKNGKPVEPVPTIGYKVEKFQNGRLTLTAFDMSGQSRYRSTWERYYAASHGVVFVIDSSDAVRLAVAANELRLMLQHPDVRQAGNDDSCRLPILVLANKTDLAAAIPIGQIRAQLGLDDVTQHPLHLEASNALTGVGLHAGLQWLCDQILHQMSK